VEKGPQDAVTFESRYSLSEEKLLRQSVDFHALTIYVASSIEHGCMEVPVRLFDCDSITQAKEKCLDALYKTTPYNRRPSPSDVDLGKQPTFYSRGKVREKERAKEMEKEREKVRKKQREKEREKEVKKVREKEREKVRKEEREKVRKEGREKVREKERGK